MTLAPLAVARTSCATRPFVAFLALILTWLSAFASADSLPPAPGPAAGLADSAALRATVYGTPLQDIAALPPSVPISEINIGMPWAKPVPDVFWYARKLRVWFTAQQGPAPLAVVISGTGSDGNTSKLSILRGALYGAGYHVLTVPSPTFTGFIVSTSTTGVAGDLTQDSRDLYAAMQHVIANLPEDVQITDIDILGYSLGGANAAMVKAIDASEGKLKIRRAVMINPPVSLFTSIGRLDKLFAANIGGQAGIERLYQQLYAQLANLYRNAGALEIDENFLLGAAATVLEGDREYSAAIALSFRLALVDMFFAGDLFAGTGVVVDPDDPPKVGDSLYETARVLRTKPFSEYFEKVFAPFYLKHRPGSTIESLIAENRLDIIADTLRNSPDIYAQTNRNDLILDAPELAWLRETMGSRIAVYDRGGHLGNLGSREQIADMLQMLAGQWNGGAQ
ncbi:MAG: hypothetical protein ABI650_11730 [Dokdonella sp.]